MTIRFAHPWTNPETGQKHAVNSTAEVDADLARTLVLYGHAVYVSSGEPPAGSYVTPSQLDARLGEYVAWAAEQAKSSRWFVRVSATGEVSAAMLPVRLTGAGVPVPAGVPVSTVQVLLASPADAQVTVTVAYETAGGLVEQIATVTVPVGEQQASAAAPAVVPAGGVVHVDVTDAPAAPGTGVTVMLVAVETMGVLAP